LGIEPTHSTASAARQRGLETIEAFFNTQMGSQLRGERQSADLLVGNNVLAHVPDINDFVGGIRELLAPEGVATLEFPHLFQLVNKREFDTIYHEHYSYLSLHAVKTIFASQKLRIFDVEELPTHGGSLRIYVAHQESQTWHSSPRVEALLESEYQAGMLDLSYYLQFQWQAEQIKNDILAFLVEQKQKGCVVVAYGAAAKGNTLLNFAGIKPDLLPYVYDAAPSKQGRFLPGSHIPILPPERLPEQNPDYVLILPWNLKEEITRSHSYIQNWGGKFVTAVPRLEIIEV
jgi:2-polyprenyl-3-methyl-5-hydroxy-6-metoxy-1,4-benzoquinol methylase